MPKRCFYLPVEGKDIDLVRQGDLNTITTQIKDALVTIGKQPGTHK